MTPRPISADSHITEPPDCYRAHIEPNYRDRAPHIVNDAASATSTWSRA
jgi:hypothetical protein